jgi:hypothetical protein
MLLIDMLYMDAPFGHKLAKWDVLWDKDGYADLFRQMDASSTNRNYIVLINQMSGTAHHLKEALDEVGFKAAKDIVWYKTTQNREGCNHLIYATENIWQAYRQTIKGVKLHMPDSPYKRHNIIIGPTNTSYHKHDDGSKINPTQKPPYLARELAKAYLQPGANVILVGCGAGGDLEGLVAAGMNVVAFEKDTTQFDALLPIWTAYQEDFKEDCNLFKRMGDNGTFGHFPSDLSLKTRAAYANSRMKALARKSQPSEPVSDDEQILTIESFSGCIGCGGKKPVKLCALPRCTRKVCKDCGIEDAEGEDGADPKRLCSQKCKKAFAAPDEPDPESLDQSSGDKSPVQPSESL